MGKMNMLKSKARIKLNSLKFPREGKCVGEKSTYLREFSFTRATALAWKTDIDHEEALIKFLMLFA